METTPMKSRSIDLEERIRNVVDADEIRSLMAKYCHGIDKKDESLFMSIWAEDGVYELPRGQAAGIDPIRQLLHKVWREVLKCHHHITNPLIEIDGDSAVARTDVIYYRQTDDGVRQLLSGTYAFRFARIAGEWKTTSLKFTSFDTVSPVFMDNLAG
jgi:ketosteroid isomerase-like protein